MKNLTFKTACLTGTLLANTTAVFAQGMDSTPAERNLQIMAEILPGLYDNANQNYFDRRRKLPDNDRHDRYKIDVKRIEAPAFGDYAFLWKMTKTVKGKPKTSYRIATLAADGKDDEVTMRHYFRMEGEITHTELATLKPSDLRRTEGCDYYFKRRASQYRGSQRDKTCAFDWNGEQVYTNNTIELSNDGLWFVDHKYNAASGERFTGVASGEPNWLERAKLFHCYSDVPGVGGGRDIPFERYGTFMLHNKGGMQWFVAEKDNNRNLGFSLQEVTWHVNNEKDSGNFNRNSLVLYVLERLEDGSVKEHGYAFADPDATRIGLNLKWMLVNCAITPRDQAVPKM